MAQVAALITMVVGAATALIVLIFALRIVVNVLRVIDKSVMTIVQRLEGKLDALKRARKAARRAKA